MPYESIDSIRSLKNDIKDILDNYKDIYTKDLLEIKEKVQNVVSAIKDIEENFKETHTQNTTKTLALIETVEKLALKNLQEARTKKWN